MTYKSLFVFLPIITLLFVACTTKDGILIYNPTATFITVTINDDVYKVGSNEQVEISLSSGSTKIKCETATEVLLDTTLEIYWEDIKDGAMLNVTGTQWYLLGEEYGNESALVLTSVKAMFELDSVTMIEMEDAAYRELFVEALVTSSGTGFYDPSKDKSVIIDNFMLLGNIEEFPADQIVISKRWDFGPKDDFADEVEVDANGLESAIGTTRKKIFKREALVSYYMDNYYIVIPEDTTAVVPF